MKLSVLLLAALLPLSACVVDPDYYGDRDRAGGEHRDHDRDHDRYHCDRDGDDCERGHDRYR